MGACNPMPNSHVFSYYSVFCRYKPKVAMCTTSSVRLTCCESADDGGAPINGFVVELAGGICATKHNFGKGPELQYQPVYTGPDANQEIMGLPAGKAYLCTATSTSVFIRFDHFSRIAQLHPARTGALLGGHADWVLIGA